MRGLLSQATWVAVALACLCLANDPARAGGISTDGGITPAQDRVVVRSRMAYLHRADSWGADNHTDLYMFPLVAAWGVLPELTVMGKAAWAHRSMAMMGKSTSDSGVADALVQVKYKLYRYNSRRHVFAAAPTLGVEVPTGMEPFSSDTWDLRMGAHLSYRYNRSAADLTAAYLWNGILSGETATAPASEAEATMALSHVFAWPGYSRLAIVPVLEVSANVSGMGQSKHPTGAVTNIAPGFKVILRQVIFEALVQIPVWQEKGQDALEQRMGVVSGVRFLF